MLGFVQAALAIRSPLNAAGPAVTRKVALTLWPGLTGSGKLIEVSVLPATTLVHRLSGTVMLSLTPTAGDPVVLVNVTVLFWLEPGLKVCSPGGALVAEAGVRLSRCTS